MTPTTDRIRRRFDGSYGAFYDAIVSRPVGLRALSVAFGFDQVLIEVPRLVQAAYADAPDEPLLDVPCGALGSLAHGHKVERDAEVVGVDLAEGMLDRAKVRVRDLAPPFQVRTVHADALAPPFDDGSFGAALSINGLHCLPDHARFAQSVARILRPGGTFTLTTLVDHGSLHSRSVNAAFQRAHVLPVPPPTAEALDAMLDDAGFDVVDAVDGRVFVARRVIRR